MFHNISVLKTFAKFNWKHLCWSFFSLKMEAACTSLKQRLPLRYFPALLASSNILLWLYAIFLSGSKLVCFDYQNRKLDSKMSSAHVLCTASLTPRATYLKISRFCRFHYARNWELLKSIMGTKFRRSHVCLYSQAGNRLWQLFFFVMLS